MSKKCFTLIHGDKVTIAPGVKIVKKEAFSQLLSGREMLKKTKEDADQYVDEVAKESEQLKEQGYRDGFDEGMRQWTEQVQLFTEEVAKAHQEVTDMVIPVALEAAKKIVGREIELSKDAVVDIVMNNLKAVTANEKVKIYANRDDLALLEANKNKLKDLFERLDSLSLIEDNEIETGGCIIETEGGIINAQLPNLWEKLESAFQSMIK